MGVIIVLRTSKVPLFHSCPSLPITLSILCLVMVGLMFALIPNLNFGGFVSLTKHASMVGYAFLVCLGYCLTAQLGKVCYKHTFHEWL
ncbi:MAG: hypothetical protein K2L48_00535 [Mycoplasmoidaceae bacterium]|nr:hypothetical protein [Mycoplasmoidaceae bacterium]